MYGRRCDFAAAGSLTAALAEGRAENRGICGAGPGGDRRCFRSRRLSGSHGRRRPSWTRWTRRPNGGDGRNGGNRRDRTGGDRAWHTRADGANRRDRAGRSAWPARRNGTGGADRRNRSRWPNGADGPNRGRWRNRPNRAEGTDGADWAEGTVRATRTTRATRATRTGGHAPDLINSARCKGHCRWIAGIARCSAILPRWEICVVSALRPFSCLGSLSLGTRAGSIDARRYFPPTVTASQRSSRTRLDVSVLPGGEYRNERVGEMTVTRAAARGAV